MIVSDGALQDTQAFTIYASNESPVFEQPQDMTVEPWHQGDQALHASDPDQDPLTFSLVNGPEFVYVKTTTPGLGNVRLTPALADSGTYQVSLAVSDGLTSQGRTFAVTVLAGTVPIMDALGDMTVSPGKVARQDLNGGDIDQDVLHFSKVSGPSFMTVTGGGTGQAGGYITLAPTLGDDPTVEGGDFDYPATVSLSDGQFSASRSFSIHIHFPGSHPPVLVQPADIRVEEGNVASGYLYYSDPDSEPLSVSLPLGPPFAFLHADSPNTTLLLLYPGFYDAGTYVVKARVTDSRGLYDEKAFRIIVDPVPPPPKFQVPIDMLAFAGRTAEQDLHATDSEGYPIHFGSIPGLCPDYVTVETIDPGSGSALGRVRVSPKELDIGRRDFVPILASNGTIFSEAFFLVEVADPARLALMHTYNPCVAPGDSTVVWFVAADPDGKPVTFQLSGLLPWMTFLDHGNGT
ncbi:MAG TPA: Ig-like domain-containing protein, partial [Tepidiformaceae bacterium]|nr:Ig-like domain-containing protein [Tepidiformaceae bacterium]